MTNHTEWFSSLEKPEKPGVVKIGDNIEHPIDHGGDVPLSHVKQKGVMRNVSHVPTIVKNLVSIRQIVDQAIQV